MARSIPVWAVMLAGNFHEAIAWAGWVFRRRPIQATSTEGVLRGSMHSTSPRAQFRRSSGSLSRVSLQKQLPLQRLQPFVSHVEWEQLQRWTRKFWPLWRHLKAEMVEGGFAHFVYVGPGDFSYSNP